MRGKFIVFEGLDASGKETQSKNVVNYLKSKGINSIYTDEPTYSNPVGLFIKDWLSKKFNIKSMYSIPLLFAADRYEHLETIIKPALEKGTWVIADRYMYSTLAYETALLNEDEEIMHWIEDIHKFILKPDLIIYIDISPEESVKRKPHGDRLENLEMQKKVQRVYYKIRDKFNFVSINGEKSREEVFEEIKNQIDKLISENH